MVQPVEIINGTPRSVRELFTGRKYGLGSYQREYSSAESNIAELLDDLAIHVLDSYDEQHE